MIGKQENMIKHPHIHIISDGPGGSESLQRSLQKTAALLCANFRKIKTGGYPLKILQSLAATVFARLSICHKVQSPKSQQSPLLCGFTRGIPYFLTIENHAFLVCFLMFFICFLMFFRVFEANWSKNNHLAKR